MDYSAAGRSDNALQRVVFVVQFKNDFSGQDYERFDENSQEWRSELPRRSVTNAILVQPGSSRIIHDENKIVGLAYEAMMKDGSVELGLRFDERRVLFVAGNYTKWSAVWPQANNYLEIALDLVPKDNPVVSFATEYTDLFSATGHYNDFDARRILRPDCQYVPPHVYERKENFHFHTGFFETHNVPAKHRILTRINADLKDDEEKKGRDLSIVLFHQISSYYEPWVGEFDLDEKIRSRGLGNFSVLHEFAKAILGEILNDEMCKEIGLS